MATRKGIDPITIEVIKNSLSSIIDQMALVITRTARSPIIKDSYDFATGLTDNEGNTLAEGLVCPVMSGVFPFFVKTIPAIFGNSIYPDDVFICNDPYGGASHIPDIYIIRPIFVDGNLVAYSGSTAHHIDFGGRVPGSNSCDNTSIYEEGLRIPPLKYYEHGVRNDAIHRLITTNVRMPDIVVGDIESQVAATSIGERSLIGLAQKHGGWLILRRYINEIMDYSERMTRADIRALPDGTYKFEDFLDEDGFVQQAIRIHLTVVVDGDNITFDFTGTSPTVKGSINLPLSSTIALVNVAMRLFMNPTTPANSGVHRPVKLIAPYDTLVNAGFPSGVAGRGVTLGRVWDTICGAFAKILPDRIGACNVEADFGMALGGTNNTGNPFVFVEVLVGSWGGRPWTDGIDGSTPPWINYSNIPCESIERNYPIRISQYCFVPDSGGAGKYRGGLGLRREYHLLADDLSCQWRQDRVLFSPWGLKHGQPGGFGKGYHITDGQRRELKKCSFFCKKGDTLVAELPGGGGYGNPLERDPDRVLDDVRNEKSSVGGAMRDYGVVIDVEAMQVDLKATTQLRQNMRGFTKT